VSSTNPSAGSGGPEYLEQGGGSPVGPAAKTAGAGRRSAIVAGGVVAGLALVGAASYGAWSWFSQGAQPAEALPASTLGYASIDLDPSGEQKIEAVKILKKFPAFNDEIKLDADDDIRKRLFEEFELGEQCEGGLDYSDDIEPWLGDRAAVAAVDTGAEEPSPVFVLQVKDADQAEDGLARLATCDGGGEDTTGWTIQGDWAVIAETDKIAEGVADDAADSPLSDDEDYQKWTDEIGDPGVINMYAAPEAGDFLATAMDSAFGMGSMPEDFAESSAAADPFAEDDFSYESDLDAEFNDSDDLGELPDELDGSQMPEEMRKLFEDFEGAALTVRFDDGALEVEMAGDAALTQQGIQMSDQGDDTLSTLPADTAFAMGVGLSEGWFSAYLDQIQEFVGTEGDVDDFIELAESETGLEFPEDIETLFGDSTAIAIGPDIDPEAFINSDSPEGLPIGAKIKGDPEAIEDVLDKIRSQMGEAADLIVTESDGDTIAIGADEGYVSDILEDGDLGDSETFQNVVREVENATAVVYVNFDAGDGWLVKLAGDDQEAVENLEPLEGVGMSAWIEDDASHVVFRVTTN
jgi:hypothetical protein